MKDLIERLEKATGPDEILDRDIAFEIGTYSAPDRGDPEGHWPAYTGSLDAAMALVPEGYAWRLRSWDAPTLHMACSRSEWRPARTLRRRAQGACRPLPRSRTEAVSDTQISLVCCTQVILQDIAADDATQKDVALTYAMALTSMARGADNPDWRTINEAIVARWSMRGLLQIKKLAWDIVQGKTP